MSRTAILTQGHLLRYVHGWEEIPVTINTDITIDYIADIALENNLTHLWIMPDGIPFQPDKHFANNYNHNGYEIKARYVDDDDSKELVTVSALCSSMNRRDTDRKQVSIMFTRNTKWSWSSTIAPKHLYITLAYLEQELGVPISGSPSTVGLKVLESIHSDGLPKIDLDLDACHFGEACSDIIWQSPRLKVGLDGYIHKFDRNMSFTSSCIDNTYGTGIPEHFDGAYFVTPNIEPKIVGVYRVKIKGKHNPLLPVPWQGGEWIATPQLRLLIHLGYDMKISEAWLFPERFNCMSKWATKMWDSRQSFETEKYKHPVCREYARQSVKLSANGLIGLMRKIRPDIRTQTVSRNAEIVYHNILQIQEKERIQPVLVYMDALYYITNSPDGRNDIKTMMRREGKLGGYKYEGCVKLTPDIQKMLAGDLGSSQKLQHLNKTGWTK